MVFYYMYDCNHNSKAKTTAGEPRMIDFEHVYKPTRPTTMRTSRWRTSTSILTRASSSLSSAIPARANPRFLKLIQMEEKPTEGKVFINGQDLTRIKRRKVPYLRRQMGVVFQDFRLIPT